MRARQLGRAAHTRRITESQVGKYITVWQLTISRSDLDFTAKRGKSRVSQSWTKSIPSYVLVQRKATIPARCKRRESWNQNSVQERFRQISREQSSLLWWESQREASSARDSRWATAVPAESPKTNVQWVHPVCWAQDWVPYLLAHLLLTKTYTWLSVLIS